MMLLNTPAPSLPIGVILPYVGLVADIPTGWALCDGQNGTVDMRNKFVMGGDHAAIGNTGGANEVTPSGSVSVSASVNNHTLSQSQMPSHNHNIDGHTDYVSSQQYRNYPRKTYTGISVGTGSAGGSGSHSHGITASGSFSANAQDNKPAYYQTAYIQRVA